MADFDSSLPVRTQTNGDVAVKIVDGTVVSNALTVDSSGKITVKLDDAAGTGITSTLLSGKQALDVNVANTSAITISGTVTVDSITNPLPSGTNTIGAVTQASGPWTQNITQVLGAAPSATNALATQIATGGAYVSSTNPLPVTIDPDAIGTSVNDYKDATAVASGASDNHDYTVTAGKTLSLKSIKASASGKAKALIQVETGVASGIFTTLFSVFNSTATPNMLIDIPSAVKVAAGVRVRVVMSNRDLSAEDLYSTICGFES